MLNFDPTLLPELESVETEILVLWRLVVPLYWILLFQYWFRDKLFISDHRSDWSEPWNLTTMAAENCYQGAYYKCLQPFSQTFSLWLGSWSPDSLQYLHGFPWKISQMTAHKIYVNPWVLTKPYTYLYVVKEWNSIPALKAECFHCCGHHDKLIKNLSSSPKNYELAVDTYFNGACNITWC